jgi:hypothetical protein
MDAMFLGARAFEPDTNTFGVSGDLDLAGAFGLSRVTFWYHTPFFWRAEEAGVLIFQSNGGQSIEENAQAGRLRLLPKPVFFLDKLGLQISEEPSVGTTHAPTGRSAIKTMIYSDGEPGNRRTGFLTIDSETAFTLSVSLHHRAASADQDIRIEMTRFEILNEIDPSLFGARTLETPGYYYGRLQG